MAHILVIEDDESVRLVIRQILAHAGHTVVEAVNGRTGIDVFYEQAPDLVITDIIMPEQEGIEVILEIKRASDSTKILAISGGGHWHDRDFCLRAAKQLGAEGTLRKPFSRVELLAEVNQLLGQEQETRD
jgi:CheY-like chemotaxis protein